MQWLDFAISTPYHMYNGLMNNNCNCEPGVLTSPQYNTAGACENPPTQLRTVVIKATEGDDSATSPYAPRLGAWQNTIVYYQKNRAVYIYDVNGVYTNLTGQDWGTTINNLQDALTQLSTSTTAYQTTTDQTIATIQQTNLNQAASITSLSNALSSETSQRETADASITSQLNNISAMNTSLQQALGAETSNREAAISEVNEALQAEITAREAADTALQTSISSITTNAEDALQAANTALASTSREVVVELVAEADPSTTNLVLSTAPLNNETITETTIPLPVASATQAGVMNMTTYQQLQSVSNELAVIQSGVVEISDLAADASQDDLTNAWKVASGQTELINQAKIYDSANDKIWTYFSNTTTWVSQPAGASSVTVDTATNNSLGVVMGSSADGQIAIEPNGAMSMNGYDTLVGDITTLQSAVLSLQDTIGEISTRLSALATGAGVTIES